MTAGKFDLCSASFAQIEEFVLSLGLARYRAEQIFRWIVRGVGTFTEMTDLSQTDRQRLEETAFLTVPEEMACRKTEDGTAKYLFRLADGVLIETVLMHYRHGNSVCISSQAGCNMKCSFCASTLSGKARDLTAGEMAAQIYFIHCQAPVSHIVLMGVGEPLDNYENVLCFLRNITNPKGLGLSQRHISLSTCGLVPAIRRLAEERLQITLSVSLHGPDDETRNKLMPINHKYNIASLLCACDFYTKVTGRRISYEYIMIRGINDTPQHARTLAGQMKHRLAHVNLIPMNPVRERPFSPSDGETVARFMGILQEKGINVTKRRRLGEEIDAACGQLRARYGQTSSER